MGSKEAKPVCWLTRLGICGTVVYLIVLGGWLGLKLAMLPNFERLLNIEANILGDFLAGAFGPPAFLWLVLGFFLQRRELQQSTEALRLQAEELRASVEQQRSLVEVSRQQFQAEKETLLEQRERKKLIASANFAFEISSEYIKISEKLVLRKYLIIKNVGSPAVNVEFNFKPDFFGISIRKIYYLDRGSVKKFTIDCTEDGRKVESEVEISYVDSLGSQRFKKLILNNSKNNRYIDAKEVE